MKHLRLYLANAVAAFLLVLSAWFALNAPELARREPTPFAVLQPAPERPPLPPAASGPPRDPAAGARPAVIAVATRPAARSARDTLGPAVRGAAGARTVLSPPVAAPIPERGGLEEARSLRQPFRVVLEPKPVWRAPTPAAPDLTAARTPDGAATPAPQADTADEGDAETTAAADAAPAQSDAPPTRGASINPPPPRMRPRPAGQSRTEASADPPAAPVAAADPAAAPTPVPPSPQDAPPPTPVARVPAPERPISAGQREELAEVAAAATQAAPSDFEPVEGMILIGVFESRGADRAIVQTLDEGVIRVGLGDEIRGWRVASIGDGGVELRRASQRRLLRMPSGAAP